MIRYSGLFALASAALLAQAPAHFAPPSIYSTPGPAYFTAAADFNGDGLVDLAGPDGAVANNTLGFFYALANPAGGYFPLVSRSIGVVVQALHAADVNRDGRADLVLVTPAGVGIMLGTATGGFSSPVYVSIPVTANHAITADFNGDGNLDVVAAGSTGYSVSLGLGTGAFQIGTLYPQTVSSFWVITGDFNRDGFLDFAGNGGSGGVTYLGNGNGTFQPPVSTLVIPWGTVTADFNQDGILDLVMHTAQPRQDGSNYAITMARGLGNGQFSTYSNYVLGNPMQGLVTGDFNADGRMDVATRVYTTGKIRVFAGTGNLTLGADLLVSPDVTNGSLVAADLDRNGSPDLVWGTYQQFFVFRCTHGNPPLLSMTALSPASVVGGSHSTGTVTLGGPAPAGGVAVTLASSDPSVAFLTSGPSVTIPAGSTSVTFDVNTAAVATASSANITATAAGVTLTGRIDVVPPYSLNGIAINPARQYGIFTVTGTVTLSGPADSSAVIALSSANPALATVPVSVTVPAGATSVTFPIALRPVAADTPVAISATLGGVSRTANITILRPLDTVAISKALLTVRTAQLKIDATSNSNATTITVHHPVTGSLLGTLANAGRGKYTGTLLVPANLTSITLKSALGGTITGAIEVK